MAFKMRCPKCFGLDYSIERDNRTFGAVAQAFELVFHCRCGKQLFGEALLKEYDAQKKEFDTNGEALPRPTTRRAEDEIGAHRRSMTPDELARRGEEDSEEDDDPRDDDDDSRPPPDRRWQQRMAEMTADTGDDDDDEDDDETPSPAPGRAARRPTTPPVQAEAETPAPSPSRAPSSKGSPIARVTAKTSPPLAPPPPASVAAPEAHDDAEEDEESEEDEDGEEGGDSTVCAWPGCTNHRRPNSKYCSRACSNKNARSRHKTRVKRPRGKKGGGGSDLSPPVS